MHAIALITFKIFPHLFDNRNLVVNIDVIHWKALHNYVPHRIDIILIDDELIEHWRSFGKFDGLENGMEWDEMFIQSHHNNMLIK